MLSACFGRNCNFEESQLFGFLLVGPDLGGIMAAALFRLAN